MSKNRMTFRLMLSCVCAVAAASALSIVGCGHDDDDHEHAAAGTSCATLAETCHDSTLAEGIACHEVGHAADEAKCVEKQAACLAICKGAGGAGGAGGAAGAGGAGGASGGAGGGGQAGSGGGVGTTSVTLKFGAKVGAQPFSCATTYTDLGTTKTTWSPKDFRLYVHGVALVRADGTASDVTLEQDGTWQYKDVALLDFEDKSGTCANGTTDTNVSIKGTVAAGAYTAVRFKLGLPHDLNHADAAKAPSPLNLTTLWWSWNEGYKFLRIDGASKAVPGFNIHLGATGCAAGDTPTACDRANLATVTLDGFAIDKTIVADLAKLVEGTNLDVNTAMTAPGCMSGKDDPECGGLFDALGLDLATGGASAKAQSFFRLE